MIAVPSEIPALSSEYHEYVDKISCVTELEAKGFILGNAFQYHMYIHNE